MKILWVEDIPSGKEAVKSVLEKHAPELDNARTYSDAISKIKTAIESYDVIFLDINLTGTTETETSITDPYLVEVTENGNLVGRASQFEDQNKAQSEDLNSRAKEFLVEAGFHLYIELLESGYPKDRIAFISANTDTSKKFSAKFKAARMEPSKSFDGSMGIDFSDNDPFGEGSQGNDKLTQWLNYRNTDYVKLRRGIIDACDELKTDKNIKKLNSNLGLSETSIKDKLDELSQILPIRKPDEIAKKRLLKRMARAIVHDWESYDPSKSTKYNNRKGYGYILKTGRNWLTHDSAHNMEVDERTIAFLFILHMRSVFKLNPKALEDFEIKLLQLFTATELEEEMLKQNIKISYRNIWSGRHYSSLYFLNLCDAQHKGDEKNPKEIMHNYSSLLFQSFFHLRFPVQCSIPKGNLKNFGSLQAFFNFVSKDEEFSGKINNNEFETELFKAFYSTTFP